MKTVQEPSSPAADRLPVPRRFVFLIAAMGSIGPFAIDTYLPALPAIGRDLGATPVQVQQTLSIYLLAFAAMTLWHGALSDALGRRRLLIVGFAVFSLASVGAAFCGSIEALWGWRALQGAVGGAGIAIGRAIARDVAHGAWPGAHERDGAVKRVAEQPAHIAEHLVIPERVAP